MGRFGRRRQMLVGVEVAPDAVRLMQFVRTGETWQLAHRVREPLPPAAVLDGQVLDVAVVGAAVARAVRASGVRSRDAAVAVPALLLERITLPAGLDDSALDALAELEALERLPSLDDAVRVDVAVLEPPPDAPDDRIGVLLAAARATTVRRCVDALARGGLVARAVDVDTLARERAAAWLAVHPVTGWQPDTDLPESVRDDDAATWPVACGLALHGLAGTVQVNLLPWRAQQQRQRGQWLLLALVASLLLGVACWWWLDGSVNAQLRVQEQATAALERQLADRQAALAELEQQAQQHRAQAAALACLHHLRGAALELFALLARTVPADVALDAVQQQGSALRLQGRARSGNDVAQWMPRLQARDGRLASLAELDSAEVGYRFQLVLHPEGTADVAAEGVGTGAGALACPPVAGVP